MTAAWEPNASDRPPVPHEVNVWPAQYRALETGAKVHEVRRFDRDFRVGDTLILREFDPDKQRFTGRVLIRLVTHITNPGTFGLPADVGVMTVVKPMLNPVAAWPLPPRPA